jgi:hypothetical protein
MPIKYKKSVIFAISVCEGQIEEIPCRINNLKYRITAVKIEESGFILHRFKSQYGVM